ncbi:hypothetical protein [Microbulbifer rhizosphaerae]|uniref:Putative membrane protein n=1 Tax=Microbulbifer rhizosphaerae TaxID=1562603 RepID=A0A7W4W9E9_9GAMM|nr:hypothetical protein [Microbulbifer rhizosphaerae]MBB3059889.1 putative membrane protein [Microbulbifer rhizosphaerae]
MNDKKNMEKCYDVALKGKKNYAAGNSHQRFVFNEDISIGMQTHSVQVIDDYGNSDGSTVGTWWNWAGINQR